MILSSSYLLVLLSLDSPIKDLYLPGFTIQLSNIVKLSPRYDNKRGSVYRDDLKLSSLSQSHDFSDFILCVSELNFAIKKSSVGNLDQQQLPYRMMNEWAVTTPPINRAHLTCLLFLRSTVRLLILPIECMYLNERASERGIHANGQTRPDQTRPGRKSEFLRVAAKTKVKWIEQEEIGYHSRAS